MYSAQLPFRALPGDGPFGESEIFMKRVISGGLVAGALVLTSSLVAVAPADAVRCVSGAEVRGQVSAFVHTLRDDVEKRKTRAAVRQAMVESVRTARGAKAGTPQERQGLGEEISALARQLEAAEDADARAAIRTAIHALQEQKRADRLTHQDVRQLKRDVRHVAHRLAEDTDTRGEGRQVAAFARALIDQFDC
jgi:hypothetical protein